MPATTRSKLAEGIDGLGGGGLPLEPDDGYVAESGEAASILQARKRSFLQADSACEKTSGVNTLIPVRFCYFPPHGGRSRREQGAAGQGPGRHAWRTPRPTRTSPATSSRSSSASSTTSTTKPSSSSPARSPENEFIGFRLKQGVYGQRQPDVQMVRVKLPFGGVTPEQMDAFADVVERYAPLNKGHITTRQNIQIHHVPLRDMESLLREISAVGLSSREGCGNTVRNVTGDPWAGVAPDEVFDPTPYAGAYVRYFVRHPTTQLMPRKIKTAFTGSDEDRAITGIHDIAFLSRERDGVKGFEVRVGGGTSIMARVAPTLYEFVEADNGDYLKVAEAVLRIFDRQDWLRVNRARARIKVLVDKIGIDAFRELVDEELEGDWVDERDFDVERLRFDDDEEANAPAPPAAAQPRPTAIAPSSSASSRPTCRPSARRASPRSR